MDSRPSRENLAKAMHEAHECWYGPSGVSHCNPKRHLKQADAILAALPSGPPSDPSLTSATVTTHDPSKYTLHNSEDGTVWQMTKTGTWFRLDHRTEPPSDPERRYRTAIDAAVLNIQHNRIGAAIAGLWAARTVVDAARLNDTAPE